MCRWMLRATAVAGFCCGVWSGGDADVGGGGGGVLCGDGRTCVGSCGGDGDCCVVVAGKVVAVLVRQRCQVCLVLAVKVQVLVWQIAARGMLNVGIWWPVCFGLVVDCPGQSWGWVGSVVLDPMVAAVEMEVGLALRHWEFVEAVAGAPVGVKAV